jgi:uncharacterized membrane protein
MVFQTIVEFVAHGLEAMGIVVMAAGGLVAMVGFVRRLVAAQALEAEAGLLRERLARATLLGLEFLVAADIIGTIAAVPTPARLVMLTGIILLRSFLNATLVLEVEGRWPWSAARRELRRLPVQRPQLE